RARAASSTDRSVRGSRPPDTGPGSGTVDARAARPSRRGGSASDVVPERGRTVSDFTLTTAILSARPRAGQRHLATKAPKTRPRSRACIVSVSESAETGAEALQGRAKRTDRAGNARGVPAERVKENRHLAPNLPPFTAALVCASVAAPHASPLGFACPHAAHARRHAHV